MLSLNIIGAGRVGKSLGRLFCHHHVFRIAQVFNLSSASNQAALAFIGEGQAVNDIAKVSSSDITLLAVPDDAFALAIEQLITAGALKPQTILFHCSGSKSSKDLLRLCPNLEQLQIQLASIHPVRSFADPDEVCSDFAGTICSVEGSPQALAILNSAFTSIGARLVNIDSENKLLYHAASVFASNYLVTLMDTAIATYVAAGVEEKLAQQMAQSLASKTLENVFKFGTSKALTGPIKRGDQQTVQEQAATVQTWDADQGALYQAFIQPTIKLANR